MSESPFLVLLKELPKRGPTDLWTPLAFLYSQHRTLVEFHRDYLTARSDQGYEESFFESAFVKNKYVLDYNMFVNCLNQLDRALKKRRLCIPNEWEIRFYRNVVVEHWDEYVDPINGSFAEIYPGPSGYPQVNIFTQRADEERKELRRQIDEIFEKHKQALRVNGHYQDIWNDSENVAKLYKTLKACFPKPDTQKCEPLKAIAKLLFQFGLPGPIVDIDLYSSKLVEQLRSHLRSPVSSPKQNASDSPD